MQNNETLKCVHLYEDLAEPLTPEVAVFDHQFGTNVKGGEWEILFGACTHFNIDDHMPRDTECHPDGFDTYDQVIVAKQKGELRLHQGFPWDSRKHWKATTIPALRKLVDKSTTANVLYWWKDQFKEFLDGLEKHEHPKA